MEACLTAVARLRDFHVVPPVLEEVLEQPVDGEPCLEPCCLLQCLRLDAVFDGSWLGAPIKYSYPGAASESCSVCCRCLAVWSLLCVFL